MKQDYVALVNSIEQNRLSKLRSRQDRDKDLYDLKPYALADYNGQALPDVVNVTLNDPKVFADRVLSVMNKSNAQAVIEGSDVDDKQAGKIESFLEDAFTEVDSILVDKEMDPFGMNLNSDGVFRGWIGSRVHLYSDDSTIHFDVRPLDMRYATWDSGAKGLLWVSEKQARSRISIEDEYDFSPKGSANDIDCMVVYDREDKHLYLDGELVDSTPHGFVGKNGEGYCPCVIKPVTMTRRMGLKDDIQAAYEHYGESVFRANRDLYVEANRLASILQTINMLIIGSSYQFQTDDPSTQPEIGPWGLFKVFPIKQGEKFELMPLQDAKRATEMALNLIISQIQRGSLPYLEYGELTFELSAVAIAKLGEGRDLVFTPIILARRMVQEKTARMIIAQFQQLGIEAIIGRAGSKNPYKPDEVSGEYGITYNFSTISAEQNIANYSVAQAAQVLGCSQEFIDEKILQIEDLAQEKERRRDQKLRKENPILDKYLDGLDLIKEGKEDWAEVILGEIGMSVESVKGKKGAEAVKQTNKELPVAGVKLPSSEVKTLTNNMRRENQVPANSQQEMMAGAQR
jgi:hypothetical protein